MYDDTKIIRIFQALLAQLEQTVSVLPQLMEDGRADNLGNKIQSYQTGHESFPSSSSPLARPRCHPCTSASVEPET
jgi:glutamate mutase epsilon subunit